MNRNNLVFDVVSVDQNNLQSLVVFEINKVSAIVRNTSIGQYIKSYPFVLNFPKSIGKSKWVVILFLNGQYEAGEPDGLIYIYLKMVHCEHQSAEFKFDIKLQLGIEYATITMKDQTLCFDDVKKRWIGTKLLLINEMIKHGSRFIQDDILLLSVHFNEHFTKRVSSTEKPHVEAETMNANLSIFPSPPRRHSMNSYGAKPSNIYPSNELHRSDVRASGSSNLCISPADNRYRIRDSNLEYVDNEFSDDEEATANSTDSKNSMRNSLTNIVKSFFKKT